MNRLILIAVFWSVFIMFAILHGLFGNPPDAIYLVNGHPGVCILSFIMVCPVSRLTRTRQLRRLEQWYITDHVIMLIIGGFLNVMTFTNPLNIPHWFSAAGSSLLHVVFFSLLFLAFLPAHLARHTPIFVLFAYWPGLFFSGCLMFFVNDPNATFNPEIHRHVVGIDRDLLGHYPPELLNTYFWVTILVCIMLALYIRHRQI